MRLHAICLLLLAATLGAQSPAPSPAATECRAPKRGWLWCDDFESPRFARYFEYDSAGGAFVRAAGTGVAGSWGMRAHFDAGVQNAGALHLAFGRTPSPYFRPVDDGTRVYGDIYWRVYLWNEPTWSGGGGYKMSRATSIVDERWAQSMIAHVWSGKASGDFLSIDPASGMDVHGVLAATRYNDFAHLRWLGAVKSRTPLFDAAHVGRWHCIEAHVHLNASGQSDGVEELWIDGAPEARHDGLNFVAGLSSWGVNAVFLENYWNGGAPRAQTRVFDNFVVATERIGC